MECRDVVMRRRQFGVVRIFPSHPLEEIQGLFILSAAVAKPGHLIKGRTGIFTLGMFFKIEGVALQSLLVQAGLMGRLGTKEQTPGRFFRGFGNLFNDPVDE